MGKFISRSCNSSCCARYLHAVPSALCSAVSTGGHGLPRHAWTEGETVNKYKWKNKKISHLRDLDIFTFLKLIFLFFVQGEMGPKGEPGTAGNRGPTGRPGKRGKQVRLLRSRLSPPQKYATETLTVSSWFGCAPGDERRSRKWRSHGPCRPAGTGGTSRPSRFTCHRWELAAQGGLDVFSVQRSVQRRLLRVADLPAGRATDSVTRGGFI